MSYTMVKAIWPGERAENLERLANSHGTAPIVWSELSHRYLGSVVAWQLNPEKVWSIYRRSDIPWCMRAVLMMTFDNVYILRRDYGRAAHDINNFLQIATTLSRSRVNHWPRLSELFSVNPHVPAIGLHCTSVSRDPWTGTWNEERDEYDPLDWSRYWSLYDEQIEEQQQWTAPVPSWMGKEHAQQIADQTSRKNERQD